MSVRLWLDHVSLSVPRLREAIERLDTRLGLRAIPSPADPDRHSRIYLDRGYIEVSAMDAPASWVLALFFLRFDDPAQLRAHLDACGIPFRFGAYEGVDGRWDDVELESRGVPLPILVRRTHPPAIASDWPPALTTPQRSGATVLAAVHVSVPELNAAADVYARLLGSAPAVVTAPAGRDGLAFPVGRGWIVLSEGDSPGIAGVVLGVTSLADTRKVVGSLSDGAIAWADPAVTDGARIGFTARPPPAAGRSWTRPAPGKSRRTGSGD